MMTMVNEATASDIAARHAAFLADQEAIARAERNMNCAAYGCAWFLVLCGYGALQGTFHVAPASYFVAAGAAASVVILVVSGGLLVYLDMLPAPPCAEEAEERREPALHSVVVHRAKAGAGVEGM